MISIGTDCSGIEAPIQALKQLGIHFKHKWSCEKDNFARKSILANYEPEIFYDDITNRNHSLLPDVDLYVCGFPCQPFSTMGQKLGSLDARSNIMFHCIKVIQKKQPNFFILENVKNFKFIQNSKPFNYLINTLNNIKDELNQNVYNIYYDIYNTKDYGIPQNRERIYIIGIKNDIQIKDFLTPPKLPLQSLNLFIINKNIVKNNNIPYTLQKKLDKIKNSSNYIFCCDGIGSPMKNISPTLTCSGCKYMYHSTYNRYLSSKECLLLQGFPDSFINAVGDVKLCNQIGNSMSVNVLKVILQEIINSTVFKFII